MAVVCSSSTSTARTLDDHELRPSLTTDRSARPVAVDDAVAPCSGLGDLRGQGHTSVGLGDRRPRRSPARSPRSPLVAIGAVPARRNPGAQAETEDGPSQEPSVPLSSDSPRNTAMPVPPSAARDESHVRHSTGRGRSSPRSSRTSGRVLTPWSVEHPEPAGVLTNSGRGVGRSFDDDLRPWPAPRGRVRTTLCEFQRVGRGFRQRPFIRLSRTPRRRLPPSGCRPEGSGARGRLRRCLGEWTRGCTSRCTPRASSGGSGRCPPAPRSSTRSTPRPPLRSSHVTSPRSFAAR